MCMNRCVYACMCVCLYVGVFKFYRECVCLRVCLFLCICIFILDNNDDSNDNHLYYAHYNPLPSFFSFSISLSLFPLSSGRKIWEKILNSLRDLGRMTILYGDVMQGKRVERILHLLCAFPLGE